MPVILTQLQTGFPGDVSRFRNSNVVPKIYDTTAAQQFQSYGLVAQFSNGTSGGVAPLTGTAQQALGVLVRPFPTSTTSIPGAINNAVPPTTNGTGVPLQADILETGFIIVNCYGGTPTAGGFAYVRVAGASPTTGPVGSIQAVADATPANTVLLDGTNGSAKVVFNQTGAASTGTNPVAVEIGFNI